MYIETVPNRSSPPAILLRESHRDGTHTRKRTLANLSHRPPDAIGALRRILRGEALVSAGDHLTIERSWPHGHVAAVAPPRVIAMIVARIVGPASKLATARGLDPETTGHTLGEELDVEAVDAEALYAALDWLEARQVHAGIKAVRPDVLR